MFKKRSTKNKKLKSSSSAKLLADDNGVSDDDNDLEQLPTSVPKSTKSPSSSIMDDKSNEINNKATKQSSESSATLSNNAKNSATKEDRLAAETNEELSKNIQSVNSNDAEATLGTTVYKGQNQYATFTKSTEYNIKSKAITNKGPVKTAANIQSTTIIDFAPDICKDFKQHGFCGYGDTCKFLHVRDDFKKTKVAEKEWESVAAKKKRKITKEPKMERLV
ncbi:U2-type spliceosomal complex subunit [Saccharomycopsis crataegensis]|uniref:Pre-mRNA-splicing factor CWC24 n=1 Tax=Saccharomycopsis crataegensis TaxID=43959 RepID=A0AAV5QFQ6_9ASCO|nr:U2-type spliceosomal complex subunit [Saccharomycopsis crataegensis]